MRFAFESAAILCELRSGNLLKLSLHAGEMQGEGGGWVER